MTREEAIKWMEETIQDAEGLLDKCSPALKEEVLKQNEVFKIAISALRFAPQPGKPLTLDQLREMDGQPVWCEDVGRWALVSVDNVGEWKGVPFALFMENGAKFNWNVEVRKLTLYSYPPAHIDRSGWISFKKRLPKTGTVLVTDGKIVITAPSSSVTKDGLAITHWMPLPEPPEEG